MEWAIKKNDLPEVIASAVMSLYHRVKTKVKVGTELSEEFLVHVGSHQRSVLSSLVFAIAVDIITNYAKEGLTNEILHADDLV